MGASHAMSTSSNRSAALREAASTGLCQSRLLLIDSSPAARGYLQRFLASRGFDVAAVQAGAELDNGRDPQGFGHAVIGFRHLDSDRLQLVRRLRMCSPDARIVVVTDIDSFATAIRALHAGADDYLPTPIDEDQLLAALRGRTPALPPVPDTPLGLNRTCWEYVMRIFEQCDRNVTHTARRLGMHRRSLQRFLGKRAPQPRAAGGGLR
jgi:two-component system response regulator RegA